MRTSKVKQEIDAKNAEKAISDATSASSLLEKQEKIKDLEKQLADLKEKVNKKVTGPYAMVTSVEASEKLQKVGLIVLHVAGGTIDDPKRYYFKSTVDKIKALKNKKGIAILSEDDMESVSDVADVKPTRIVDTNLKEMVTQKGPERS